MAKKDVPAWMREKRTCLHCGREFEPKKRWQKYCRDACRLKGWFARNYTRKEGAAT